MAAGVYSPAVDWTFMTASPRTSAMAETHLKTNSLGLNGMRTPSPYFPSNGKWPEIDGSNTQCCLDKGVADTLHCGWYMRKDMVYYSENQGAK